MSEEDIRYNLVNVFIYNEECKTDDGRRWHFCKCHKWLPEPLLGFVDTFVGKMRCRDYLCPECYDKRVTEGVLMHGPLMTRQEYIETVMRGR